MPWCPECDRFLAPPTVRADGTCPTCGRAVDPGTAPVAGAAATASPEDEQVPVPWHLKLLAGAVVVYLGFRAWAGVEWVIHQF